MELPSIDEDLVWLLTDGKRLVAGYLVIVKSEDWPVKIFVFIGIDSFFVDVYVKSVRS